MYAIVDIETTGGIAGRHRITEIAVVLHNGTEVTGTYQTLVNPEQDIPPFITQLTGITAAMVADAPTFEEIAPELYELLKDKVFVAHNAAFDYSFIRKMLEEEGFPFHAKKLCTVKLSRKILPGKQRYSLGNLCRELGIAIRDRHRAMGDAEATAVLFQMLLDNDLQGWIPELLQQHKGHQPLPPHLDKEHIAELPRKPGVYYFHDRKGQLLYVGKARSIRNRVRNHFNFADHDGFENKLRDAIHEVRYEETGNELIALLLELDTIKRKKPPFNKAMKYWSRNCCIFCFTGQDGKLRLAIERYRTALQPIKVFPNYLMAREYLKELVDNYRICPQLSHLQSGQSTCFLSMEEGGCLRCTEKADVASYNDRVLEAIHDEEHFGSSYLIQGKGRHEEECSLVLVENGHYLGFGFHPLPVDTSDLEKIRSCITWRPDLPDVQYLIMRHLEKHPESRLVLSASAGVRE